MSKILPTALKYPHCLFVRLLQIYIKLPITTKSHKRNGHYLKSICPIHFESLFRNQGIVMVIPKKNVNYNLLYAAEYESVE